MAKWRKWCTSIPLICQALMEEGSVLIYLTSFSLFLPRVCLQYSLGSRRALVCSDHRFSIGALLFCLSCSLSSAAGAKRSWRRSGGTPRALRPHASCARLGYLCRPAAVWHVRVKGLCAHWQVCIVWRNNVPAIMHVGSSNLEMQPSCLHTRRCAQTPPFLSSAHQRVHRNNCTNTNRCAFGRAIPSAAIPGRVSHLRAGHQQQRGCLMGGLPQLFLAITLIIPSLLLRAFFAVVSCCILTRCEKQRACTCWIQGKVADGKALY